MILPFLMSSDEDCRLFASAALANVSAQEAAHKDLLGQGVVRYIVAFLEVEKAEKIIRNLILALGNIACESSTWPQLKETCAADCVSNILKGSQQKDIKKDCVVCLANLVVDPWHQNRITGKEVYDPVWKYMTDPAYPIGSVRTPSGSSEDES